MTTPALPLTDAELIARTRNGDVASYDELYRRHVDDARRVARIVTDNSDEADDVVSEAFTRVLDRFQRGGGPDEELTPYLRTVVRRLAVDRYRSSRRDGTPADPALLEVVPEPDDPMARATDRELVRKAFDTLPDRWQQVLWYTEIEGRSPASLATTLGSTPNAVAALAYRAREGLRQAYLSVHLSSAVPEECRPFVPKLAGFVRGTLRPSEDRWVAAHLEQCEHCRDRRDEVMVLVTDLRGVLWPALLGPVVLAGGGAAVLGAVGGATSGAAVGAAAAASASAGTPAAISGIAAWIARIRPDTVLGQVATTTASVAAATAVVAGTIVVVGGDPPVREDVSVAAPVTSTDAPAPSFTPAPTSTTTPTPTPTPTLGPPVVALPQITRLDDQLVVEPSVARTTPPVEPEPVSTESPEPTVTPTPEPKGKPTQRPPKDRLWWCEQLPASIPQLPPPCR